MNDCGAPTQKVWIVLAINRGVKIVGVYNNPDSAYKKRGQLAQQDEVSGNLVPTRFEVEGHRVQFQCVATVYETET